MVLFLLWINKSTFFLFGVKMALLSKRSAEEDLADELISQNKVLLKDTLGNTGIKNLRNKLVLIGKDGDYDSVRNYMNYTLGRIKYIDDKKSDFQLEAKLADKVYKAYVTDGVSRLEKVNGRFMASQSIKLDMLIEQNDIIIGLLKEINNKL